MKQLLDLCEPFLVPPPFEVIDGPAMPEPYRTLLVHTNHMTVTVETHYGQAVDVQVLGSRIRGDLYEREILLRTPSDKRAVQFGIVRVRLDLIPDVARMRILAQDTPLGRVLILNKVLARVEPTHYLHFTEAAPFDRWFEPATPLYGRLGVIHAAEQPAIEMLEVLAPIV